MIPPGITTAIVHMDAPVSFVGEPGRLHVTIEPSVSLIWTATGTPMGNFVDTLALDSGVELRINLPHTDQAGFQDAQGNAYTGWYYSITVVYERNGHRIAFPKRDFQLLTGQDEVDLALIPADEAVPAPQVAPILPVTSIAGFTGAVTKAMLALDKVNNTSDAAKPISTATQAALNTKADAAATTSALNTKANTSDMTAALAGKSPTGHRHTYADIDGTVPTSALPPLAINEVFPAASQTAMLALTAQRGDVAVRSDINRTFILSTDSPGTLADWKEIMASGQVLSVAGRSGAVVLTKADVGLGNVDNTSDAAKPISSATQAALNAKAADDALLKGTAGRKYRLIAGTIRNTGTGWAVLNDTGHRPTGVTGVTADAEGISIAFAATAKVVSFVCGVDETYASRGLRVGASVGLTSAKILAYEDSTIRIGDYVTWDGTSWTSANGVFTGIAFNGTGLLTLNHVDMGLDRVSISATARPPLNGAANTVAHAGGFNTTVTQVELRTPAGVVINQLANPTRLYVERSAPQKSSLVNPAALVEATGNIWFVGVVED